MTTPLTLKLNALQDYSACDVSDALLKLQKVPDGSPPRAGYLVDLVPFAPSQERCPSRSKIIAPASTFKFVAKTDPDLDPRPESPSPESHGFPPGKHWVDHADVGSIAVLEQPSDQACAVLGGIMAVRMKYLGVRAAVVGGRVRDLRELNESELPVWARATSTVGTGAEAKPAARNIPISIGGVTVSPGDIIFCDPLEGVVAIPAGLLDQVLDLMPKLIAMDDQVKDAVGKGLSVFDAFKKFRR